MERLKQIKLEEGKEYRIELFPKKDIVSAKYYKKIGSYYIFVNDDNSSNCFVNSHFMIQNEEGIITHSPFSSAPVQFGDFNEEAFRKFLGLTA
ncbi:hypothetical protein HYW74_00485 [Candidatus Pacearchaeota archaeon]|nr:hypothetical protein [Candidatus Pacearchaeota archaeon]